jgi:hypothetical protein
VEETGFCDDDDCDCCIESNNAYQDLRRALALVDAYKGVK